MTTIFASMFIATILAGVVWAYGSKASYWKQRALEMESLADHVRLEMILAQDLYKRRHLQLICCEDELAKTKAQLWGSITQLPAVHGTDAHGSN